MNAQQLLSVSVTPVVLISACGLIATALYSRLGAILARILGYHQKKLELLEYRKDRLTSERNLLLLVMDSQIAQMTAKARMIQRALFGAVKLEMQRGWRLLARGKKWSR